MDKRFPDNGQFIRALSMEHPDVRTLPYPDLTMKKLRMVFTISKKRNYVNLNDPSSRFSPADRIEYLTFRLTLPETNHLRFMQWNRFSTEYGEIEIADVTFSRSLNLEAEAAPYNMDVSPRGTLGRNEAQEVRSRYLKINGAMGDRWIEIEEEGTREIDLTGNVVADIALRFEGFPERLTVPVFEANSTIGSVIAPVIGLTFQEVLVPRMEDAPDTLMADLKLDYIYRHVRSGSKTFQEWDDRVEYYSGSIEKQVPILTRDEYIPEFFYIGEDQAGKRVLTIRMFNGNEYPMQFASYREASRVLDWLMTLTGKESVKIGQITLLFGGDPVSGEAIARESDLKVLPVY
jgi:hypothetical protein